MKNIMLKIPGFRTDIPWKKKIALITYPIIAVLILLFLLGSISGNPSSHDKLISSIWAVFIIIILIIVPYILITNFGDIRNKLPLFKSTRYAHKILASVLTFVLILLTSTYGASYIDQFHSSQYIEQEALKAEAKKKKEQAEKASEEKLKNEEAAKIAEEKKTNQVRDQLAVDTTVIDKNAMAQTQIEQKNEKPPLGGLFGWFGTLFEKTEEEKQQELDEKTSDEKLKNEEAIFAAEKKTEQVKAKLAVDATVTEKNAIAQIEQEEEIPTSDSPQVTETSPNIIPGFIPYESDGFKIQVPNHWIAISSKIQYRISGDKNSLDSIKVPLAEDYKFMYDEYRFFANISIVPKATFEKDRKSFMYLENYQPATVKNSELSYVAKNFSNSLVSPSTYKIIALRGDVCYILRTNFTGYSEMEIQGGSYDSKKEELQRYLSEIELMVPSFELTSDYSDFKSITQNNQNLILIKNL